MEINVHVKLATCNLKLAEAKSSQLLSLKYTNPVL